MIIMSTPYFFLVLAALSTLHICVAEDESTERSNSTDSPTTSRPSWPPPPPPWLAQNRPPFRPPPSNFLPFNPRPPLPPTTPDDLDNDIQDEGPPQKPHQQNVQHPPFKPPSMYTPYPSFGFPPFFFGAPWMPTPMFMRPQLPQVPPSYRPTVANVKPEAPNGRRRRRRRRSTHATSKYQKHLWDNPWDKPSSRRSARQAAAYDPFAFDDARDAPHRNGPTHAPPPPPPTSSRPSYTSYYNQPQHHDVRPTRYPEYDYDPFSQGRNPYNRQDDDDGFQTTVRTSYATRNDPYSNEFIYRSQNHPLFYSPASNRRDGPDSYISSGTLTPVTWSGHVMSPSRRRPQHRDAFGYNSYLLNKYGAVDDGYPSLDSDLSDTRHFELAPLLERPASPPVNSLQSRNRLYAQQPYQQPRDALPPPSNDISDTPPGQPAPWALRIGATLRVRDDEEGRDSYGRRYYVRSELAPNARSAVFPYRR